MILSHLKLGIRTKIPKGVESGTIEFLNYDFLTGTCTPPAPESSTLPPFPIHPLPQSSPLRNRGLGERRKLPSGVWGIAAAEIEFSAL